jgi:Tol biopolymer transport system component
LYIASPDLKERYLVFAPPPGTSLHTVSPSFSPDSKWLTFSTTDGSIWICDITGTGARRLSGPGDDKFSAWSKTP